MKVIACCGYHATGSGVIDDLLREFDNTKNAKYGVELRILHDTDGISDLEYHIVHDPSRLGTGLAIHRFIEYARVQNPMRRTILGDKWMSLVKEYAESIAVLKFKGWRFSDVPFMSKRARMRAFLLKSFFYVLRRKPIVYLVPKNLQPKAWYDFYPSFETYYSNITKDEFLIKTKKFINTLCNFLNPEGKEFMILDQFTSVHNPMRDLQYVDDMKVVIVDRDPRDLYVHNMLLKDHRLPKDPKQFAIQYRLMRKIMVPDDPSKVLRVRYEDMIFNYDEMVKRVMDFLGTDSSHHVCPKKYFNPGVSINGTQLWIHKFIYYDDAIKIIEKELPDMLYDFPDEYVRKQIESSVNQEFARREYSTKH